jgi:Cu/Ag efflux protein CusF
MYFAVVVSVTITVWVILAIAAIQTYRETNMWKKKAHKATVEVIGFIEKMGQKVGVEVLLQARMPNEKCRLYITDKEELSKIKVGDKIEALYFRVLSGTGKVGVEKSNKTEVKLANYDAKKDAKKMTIILITIAILVPAVLWTIYHFTH